ncbi:uncharacterized protein LOC135216418 isoform X2 [Macrobrachium nipponense]|uniref:uncharacterized protein LOC135216418 isoform X2 n=1 Tax=Macrobrachium nipponense TaxID=159736 RepID=UPI0030C83ECF
MSSSTYRSQSWMRYRVMTATQKTTDGQRKVDIEHILLPQAPHHPSEEAQDIGSANGRPFCTLQPHNGGRGNDVKLTYIEHYTISASSRDY